MIGVNGAGKSTLLSLICGELEPDEGAVSIGENARIGYLKQNSGLESGNTIFEEMQSVFAPLLEAQRRMQELSRRMQGASGQEYQELSQQFSQLQSYFETNEGYQIDPAGILQHCQPHLRQGSGAAFFLNRAVPPQLRDAFWLEKNEI